MKSNIINGLAALTLIAGGCTSYEIDMPANPEPPVVGHEVSKKVAYQANPAFFGNNDCLNALKAQLPRISDMGADILWIMPINQRGELKAIGSPYCVKDFTEVNPRYGTLADLKALVDEAHSMGMIVILDWIANHTAWDCPWITEHPDWYVHDAAGNIVSPSGWTDVAQLDYSNEGLRQAMTDAMTYWVENADIDGYRCDYADGVPHDFWTSLITGLRTAHPDLLMLAESANTDFYADGFDMIYDWNSSTSIAAAFTNKKTAEAVQEGVDALAKVPEGKSILRYVFNHDVAAENSVNSMYGSWDAVPAAYVVAAMLNGTPLIYSSMDVENMSGKLSFFDYNSLTFSPALTAKYKAINAAFKMTEEVRRGQLYDYSTSSAVCFTRSIPEHNLLVVVNTTDEAQDVRVPINLAGSVMTDLINGGEITVPYVVNLEAYSYTILMQ